MKKSDVLQQGLETAAAIAAPLPLAFHRINALLHTMRAIDRNEESLSALMCEIKAVGAVSQEVRDELCELLDEIPAHDLLIDLQALGAAIHHAAVTKLSKQKKTRKKDKRKNKELRKAAKQKKRMKKKARGLKKK